MFDKVLGAMGVQALISTMLTGTCCYLWATLQVVPTELFGLTGIVVAHWMGRKGVESAIEATKTPAPPPVFIPG